KEAMMACYRGGARVFEFTNRGTYAHDLFIQLSRYAKEAMPEMILGIGSVYDEGTASLYIQCGADFIVSPILHSGIAKVCNRRKVAWMPGCGTMTEISQAEELGAEVVKVFPAAQVGGPSFIKAAKAPAPWSSLMATGGVDCTEENLRPWFEAGVFCVGIGSKLFKKNSDGELDLEKIQQLMAFSIKTIADIRAEV
ncbi:MAG: bifunctional 4-hydroxy-2-oxoglutarate aldolase/2-dehydro-3-deoxy-phosphogluconate aldolase, partial [Bacteroidota bacterium]